MTEVPDYLLQRSRERRVELGLLDDDGSGGGDAGAGAGAADSGGAAAAGGAAAGAVAATSAAEDTAAAIAAAKADAKLEVQPAPQPDPQWVTAARTRHRIPIWALPVLFALPLWGFVYVKLTEPPPEPITAITEGANTYAVRCSSCHVGDGSGSEGGGVGRPLYNGEAIATFPTLGDDLLEWIKVGTAGVGTGNIYGDPNRLGGPRIAGETGASMPAFGEVLSVSQVYSVARYVREVIAGEEITDEEAAARDEKWELLGGGKLGGEGGGGGDGHG